MAVTRVLLPVLLLVGCGGGSPTPEQSIDCDVVVIGGSVAGLAAAVTAAKEGATTCLLAATDMLGGQMSGNGIPALDFSAENGRAPFNITGASPDTMEANMPADFFALLRSLPGPNYRNTCWVSPYCFLPTAVERRQIQQLLDRAGPNLKVFRSTVLLSAATATTATTATTAVRPSSSQQPVRIESVTAVQRAAVPGAGCNGYASRLSESMQDWYSTADSAVFNKTVLTIRSGVWVDTSYNGELLVLSGAPYLQGIDEAFDGDTQGTAGNDTIGQSFTMTFQVHLRNHTVPKQKGFPPMDPGWKPDPFRSSPAIHTPNNRLSWESLWTRRRSYHAATTGSPAEPPVAPDGRRGGCGMDPPPVNNVTAGDVHLAAWPDYYYGYVFQCKTATAASIGTDRWSGGYDLDSIDGAERYSYGAFEAYRDAAPPRWQGRLELNASYMGTCNGLAKMPYIRDGRRSVGLDGFVISMNFTRAVPHPPDCIALVGHGFDIWGHRMMTTPIDGAECAQNDTLCRAYPPYMRDPPVHSTGYTCAPLRALTNKVVGNLLVGGYTMAQSFMVNSALRMHPEEFAVGVGAGAAAAHMASLNATTTTADLLEPSVTADIQARVRKHAPLAWAGTPRPEPPPPPPHSWPKAVGVVCAAPLARCVEVPGGGSFSTNNTRQQCLLEPPGCPALGQGEWLAIAGSVLFDHAKSVGTFRSATRIKKSAVNSLLLPPAEVLAVKAGQRVQLAGPASAAFTVDRYSYVLLRCATARCAALLVDD